MSTYGTAIVIDVPDGVDPGIVSEALIAMGGDVYTLSAPDGWQRATAYIGEIERVEQISQLLRRVGTARAAIAEDNDEFGALWVVLGCEEGEVWTAHRRYILNADPSDEEQVTAAIEDLGGDPRSADVASAYAAAAAARLFGVDAQLVIAAEDQSLTAFEGLGVVGGPFPWWSALGLPWPQAGVGPSVDA